MDTSYLALEFGTLDGGALIQNTVAAALYFVVGITVLGAGFLLADLLTPGSLRHLVFVQHRPNAVAVACGMYLALAMVTATAIVASSAELGQGLVDALVYGLVGVLLQGAAPACCRGRRRRPGPRRCPGRPAPGPPGSP